MDRPEQTTLSYWETMKHEILAANEVYPTPTAPRNPDGEGDLVGRSREEVRDGARPASESTLLGKHKTRYPDGE